VDCRWRFEPGREVQSRRSRADDSGPKAGSGDYSAVTCRRP